MFNFGAHEVNVEIISRYSEQFAECFELWGLKQGIEVSKLQHDKPKLSLILSFFFSPSDYWLPTNDNIK